MIRSLIRPWIRLAAVLSLVAGSAHAQSAAVNPHGPIDLDCAMCHGEGSWETGDAKLQFDHATTGFVLEGRHAGADCRDCHEDPRFAFVGTQCADCHIDVHGGSLGLDCEECHSPARWVDPPRFREMHDATAFALVGAHGRADCEACHLREGEDRFAGTPVDCWHCHHEDWAATTNPDHEATGMGTDCVTCHSPFATTWGGGDFVHPASFPLTGGHAGLSCADCHESGFGAAPTDCYACHRGDYENTSDPNHLSAGFPTDCAACHSPLRWEPADWDHDTLFPIYSGTHREKWNSCADCHVVATNYSVFECIDCHEHNRTDTDDDHDEVGDYEYVSSACLQCHPDGRD